MEIAKYEIIEKLAETPRATVFKAYPKNDPSRLLVLKVLKAGSLSEYQKAQFRQKIEHLKVLNDSLVITPISFAETKEGCYITQNYFEGVTLDTLREARGRMAFKDFFVLACGLARALDKIHEAGIIHAGVKPHNILVHPGTLDLRLIDFISALDVRDISHFIYDPSFIRDTLAYTSPEQTGRISHRVVFSSDMYSLGIVFYELLTDRLPFVSDDPLEVIHSHLAEEAPQVHELNPQVPVTLSRIITKLMLKEPEKRYQSSNGLLADLVRCREEYAATGAISEFPLESRVYTHRVTFISKMVGRDQEAKTILEEYEQVAQGSFRSMFISGLSGIGKTRLIQELQKPIVKHRGYFTSGKFDVYQKNIPYSSLIQALRNLMRTFLTESDERVAAWKARILAAVGASGKVLTDVVPELRILIGSQPEVPPLPPVEALNRFHDVFDKFLTCLASRENPLTLFIDDLQWCDIASFDFFANIFANYQDHPYLFFLGAYRHNEVDGSHPLTKLIHNTREANQPLGEVRLGPLRPEHCHVMVAYILDAPLGQTKALADFLSDLSEGNPLFVSESLSYLHNADLLFQDKEGQWRWDMEKIRSSNMPKTVVALFSSKIQKLPPDTIHLLEYCACMGNSFSPSELALIRDMPLVDTFETLKPALGQGLLMENKNRLQFIHDKVQEASLAVIPSDKRRQIHRLVGNHLLAVVPPGAELEKLDNLFTIVSHLNLARDDHPDSPTAYRLSDLNYHAGNKALDSLATEAANEYFRLSRELLPADCWQDGHYERTFTIFQRAAKTELMCGNYENSERLLNELLEHASTDLDKAECLAEQTTSLSSIGNFIKAIETANRGLAYFEKAIPDQPQRADRCRKKLMSGIAAQKTDVWNTILNMPFTQDRQSKIELKFYSELIPDLYMSGLVPQLYLSAAQSTQHCLAGGMDESVIYSFSIMGLQLGEQEEFESAFRYEDLARDLSAKYPNTFGATRGMNGIVWCNAHSRNHPSQIVAYCLKSIQCGKNCGDLYNAGLSYGPLMWNLQVQGADLSAVEDYAKECLQFSSRYHLSFSVGLAEAMQAGWVAPMKNGYSPVSMDEKLRQWARDNHVASAGSYCVHMALAHYYFGEYEKAQTYLEEVKQYLTGLTDNVLKRQWHVFRVLNALKLHENGLRFPTKEELRAEIQPLVKKIETWATLGPLLKPYLAFLQAERARVLFNKEAWSLYLEAINAAHKQEYTFLEGHLHECLGELLYQTGQCSAKLYFAEAVRLYKKCRAERKETRLLERHPEYFEEEKALSVPLAAEPSSSILPNLDVDYLMKSSQAISAEIEMEALLKKIMNVVLESTGAQHGYLLMDEGGDLVVRAESHIAEKERTRTLDRRLEDAPDICKAVVRYVHRTGERLIFGNAGTECSLRGSLDCLGVPLCSLLCLPVVKQSKTVGILYLENRLMESAFTPEKTQMTELLTSQAAISLENACLVKEMKVVEEELRARDEELQLVSDAGPTLISYVDAGCRYRRANKVYEEWFGLRATEVRGRPVREVVGEAVWQVIHPHMERALAGEQVTHEQKVLLPKAGKRWINTTYTPDRDESGRVRGFVVHAVDITERKRAEEALREARDELEIRVQERTAELKRTTESLRQSSLYARSLIEASLDPLVTISADGKITDVNEATIKVTGVPREQLIGTDVSNYFTEPARAREGYQQVFAKGFVTDYPLTIRHQDGQLTDVLYNASVYKDTHGDVLGVFAAARDITERKRAETELARYRGHLEELVLQRTEDLARSNRDLEQFAYVASHDLQEPLRAVGGFVGLLQQRYQGQLDEKADGYIGSAVDGVTRMQTLIGDLLSYSRVGTKGKAMEPTDTGESVEDALTNLRASIEESGAVIQVDPLPTVQADATQLTQLYQNLIANALKFRSDKPPEIHIGARREQDAWLFWVRDNGIGIDRQYAERIFLIFQRLHTRKAYPGTGIGLAICKRIVERHGGSIWVESQPGQGSAFYFTLPDKGEPL